MKYSFRKLELVALPQSNSFLKFQDNFTAALGMTSGLRTSPATISAFEVRNPYVQNMP